MTDSIRRDRRPGSFETATAAGRDPIAWSDAVRPNKGDGDPVRLGLPTDEELDRAVRAAFQKEPAR